MSAGRRRSRDWVHRGLTAASVVLVVIAFVVLHRLLRDLDYAEVAAALRDLSAASVLCAAALAAGAYVTLTFYDYFALRTLGYAVPYRVAALAGFTSYAIGHNVGATTFVAAAIRYRVYAAHGLDALGVAKVCLVAGTTFWLGNAAALGIGVVVDPAAAATIDRLPENVNLAAGATVLSVLGLYLLWVGPHGRHVGLRDARIRVPGRASTLLQIAIGTADLALCATAVYLLASDANVPFVRIAVVFVCATLLGFASHAPAGLGAFDATMLIGLPEVPTATMVAVLIVYRLLYYLLPFAVAIALLVGREVVTATRRMSQGT